MESDADEERNRDSGYPRANREREIISEGCEPRIYLYSFVARIPITDSSRDNEGGNIRNRVGDYAITFE